MFNGYASKFVVSVLGAVASSLGVYYGTARWEPAVIAALTAVAVYLVPNTPPVEVAPVQPSRVTHSGRTP